MNVFFRVDASIQIGSGHVMRCLTLADVLRKKETKVRFICRELSGNLCRFIESKGFPVSRLPNSDVLDHGALSNNGHLASHVLDWKTDAEQSTPVFREAGFMPDWLIVDHYSLDACWETRMRPFTRKIMVIDDLADRPHDCDLLLDQNLYENLETRYDDLVSEQCQKLLGPKYVLLRPEFREARKNLRERDGMIRRILIFFGGSDPNNETSKALEAVLLLERSEILVDVVVGRSNPHKEQLRELCSSMPNVTFYCNVNNIAEMMADADLAIGAGGSTTWERCLLALPTITIVIAQNQSELISAVAETGAIRNLGWYEKVGVSHLFDAISSTLEDPLRLREMGEKAMTVMGGSFCEGEPVLVQLTYGQSNV